MTQALGTLDPTQYVMSFRGIIIGGFATGEQIVPSRSVDAWTIAVGGQGDVARIYNPDESGTVTVNLMQSSSTNEALSAVLALDCAESTRGQGVGELLVADLTGLTVWKSMDAWIVKLPDGGLGNELGVRTWVFACAKLQGVLAGPTRF